MDIQSLNRALEEIYHSSHEIYKNAAESESEYLKLKNLKDTTLAVIMNHKEGSDAAKKRQAQASEKYNLFLEALHNATQKHLEAKAAKLGLETRLSAIQSLCKMYKNDSTMPTM